MSGDSRKSDSGSPVPIPGCGKKESYAPSILACVYVCKSYLILGIISVFVHKP